MNRRYERASTVLTSNKGFEEWAEVLWDDVMAAALSWNRQSRLRMRAILVRQKL
jgi:DNA replication protein DnaC